MRDPDYERPDPFRNHDPNLPPDHQGMFDPGNDDDDDDLFGDDDFDLDDD